MFKDFFKYPWVIRPPVEFKDTEHLLELLPSKIIAAAEEKCHERRFLLDQLFPPIERK